MNYPKHHYRLVQGRWMCRDAFGEWWLMPGFWKPGMSVKGFVMR